MKRFLPFLLSALSTAACSADDADLPSAPEPKDALARIGTFPVDEDGLTPPIHLELDAPLDHVLLRLGAAGEPGDAAHFCFAIEEMRDDAGNAWVAAPDPSVDYGPFCRSCSRRVAVASGYGLFVFPSDGRALPDVSELTVTAAVRDCLTFLPSSRLFDDPLPAALELHVAQWSTAPPEVPLRIRWIALEGSRLHGTDVSSDPLLSDAAEELRRLMLDAGIEVEVVGAHSVTTGLPGPLTFDRTDLSALDAAHAASAAALPAWSPDEEVPVFLSPCLVRRDPLDDGARLVDGFVPRIPGGFAPEGHADGVFVRDGACEGSPATYWPSGSSLATVVAHELGHYLGLFHTVEADGTPDHLDDTSNDNIMHPMPLSTPSRTWSPQQRQVLAGHPIRALAR